MAFLVPKFTKLTNVQQHYVQTSNTHFHPNGTINVGSTARNLFTPYVKYGFSCDNFHEIHYRLNLRE